MLKEELPLIQNSVNEFNDTVKKLDKLTDEVAKKINENKLQFGLQGSLKSQLLKKANLNLNEEQDYVLHTPILPIGKGGRKTRKNKRKLSSKIKKA
jgi:hypothetical protein